MPWGQGVTTIDGRRLAGDVADAGVDEAVVVIVVEEEMAPSQIRVRPGRASGLFTQTDQAPSRGQRRRTEWEGVKILQNKEIKRLLSISST